MGGTGGFKWPGAGENRSSGSESSGDQKGWLWPSGAMATKARTAGPGDGASGAAELPNKVENGLFIGSVLSEQNHTALSCLSITHVLQTADLLQPSHKRKFKYLSIPVIDLESEDLVTWFPKAFAFIEEGIHSGGVLVHCAAGVSRSATFVLGFLMSHRHMSLSTAMHTLQSARPEVCPNNGFFQQLEEFERIGCDTSKWTPWSQVWSSESTGGLSLNPFASFSRPS